MGDMAIILYTAGTTGRLEGAAMLTGKLYSNDDSLRRVGNFRRPLL